MNQAGFNTLRNKAVYPSENKLHFLSEANKIIDDFLRIETVNFRVSDCKHAVKKIDTIISLFDNAENSSYMDVLTSIKAHLRNHERRVSRSIKRFIWNDAKPLMFECSLKERMKELLSLSTSKLEKPTI